jgi:3'(2'), 5'-bisphosphate nucleotidase
VSAADVNDGAPTVGAADVRAAVAAVRGAVRACRAVRAGLLPEQAVQKEDRSPVTVADFASQALISLALADALPVDPVIGEESSADLRGHAGSPLAEAVLEHVGAQRPEVDLDRICWALDRCNDAGGPSGRHWAVDPVDGTKGFLRNEQYAVALALIVDGQVALGVLGCPNLVVDPSDPASDAGCLFLAARDGGAWQLPLDDAGDVSEGAQAAARPISVAALGNLAAAQYVESYESGHSSQADAARIASALGITAPPLRMDSQAKYAVVARGQADIYLRLPEPTYVEKVWDHAAGSIIASEAGAVVTDAHGRPLDFSTGRTLSSNRGLIVAPAAVHGRVVEAAAGILGQ